MDEVDEPNVVVHADAYHMNIEENDFRTPILAAGDRLGYVHLGENHRGYMGQGHVDFPELFRALVEVGYEGTITFESFSSAVVDEDLSRTLRIWRNVWTDGMDLARSARRADGGSPRLGCRLTSSPGPDRRRSGPADPRTAGRLPGAPPSSLVGSCRGAEAPQHAAQTRSRSR
jgi:hypothetical protein